MENKHAIAIPTEEIGSLLDLIGQLKSKLKPYAVTMSAQEHLELTKYGPRTADFVKKGCMLAEANPDLCPGVMDVAATKIDLSDIDNLVLVKSGLQELLNTVTDIQMLAGSDAFQSVLSFYGYLKFLADRNVTGAKEKYEDLKASYPKTSRRKAAATPEATA